MKDLDVTVACDVCNPLLGAHGAAAVYGPQKGASEEQVLILDKALAHFAELVENASVSRETYSSLPGAGAAGGLGFACFVMGAKMRPGVEVCFELTGFHEALDSADVVITGEGNLDTQTLEGKGPAGVADAARRQNIPVYAVCGSSELTEKQLVEAGFSNVFAVLDSGVSLADSLAHPAEHVEKLGQRLAQELRRRQD